MAFAALITVTSQLANAVPFTRHGRVMLGYSRVFAQRDAGRPSEHRSQIVARIGPAARRPAAVYDPVVLQG